MPELMEKQVPESEEIARLLILLCQTPADELGRTMSVEDRTRCLELSKTLKAGLRNGLWFMAGLHIGRYDHPHLRLMGTSSVTEAWAGVLSAEPTTP